MFCEYKTEDAGDELEVGDVDVLYVVVVVVEFSKELFELEVASDELEHVLDEENSEDRMSCFFLLSGDTKLLRFNFFILFLSDLVATSINLLSKSFISNNLNLWLLFLLDFDLCL